MQLARIIPATLTVAALVTSACGSTGSEQDARLPDAERLTDDADALGVSALALAFDQAGEAVSYRMEMAMGMDMSAAGQDISFEADPATPMVFVEADSDGEQYTRMDMAPMMTAMLGGSELDTTGLFGGDLSMETWMTGDILIMDVGGFGPILEQNAGTAELFPADIFTVDLGQLQNGVGGAEVAAAMSGQSAPDPVEMARVLRRVLGDTDAVAGSDNRFAGSLTFFEYSEAFGQNPDAMLGGMNAAFDEMGSGESAQMLLDVFADIDVDVEVILDAGAVDTIRFDADMSPIWSVLGDMMVATGETFSAADLAEFNEMFADATFDITMLLDYDIDDTVDVIVPTGEFPDATDAFLDVFATPTTHGPTARNEAPRWAPRFVSWWG